MSAGPPARYCVRRIAIGVAVAATLWVANRDGVLAAEVSIEVDERQHVTISGNSDSLRSTIEEICERAGVALLAYEAEDRPFTAAYDNVPLSEAFARLLRSEIFLLGLQPRENSSGQVVTWIRVSGAKGAVGGGPVRAGSPMPSPSAGAGIDIGVAADVLETALTSDDTIARNTARRTILENLRSNPAALQRLLERDPVAVVERLMGSRHAAEFLNSLQSVASGVQQRTQVQTLLRSLRLRQEAARREAAADQR